MRPLLWGNYSAMLNIMNDLTFTGCYQRMGNNWECVLTFSALMLFVGLQ